MIVFVVLGLDEIEVLLNPVKSILSFEAGVFLYIVFIDPEIVGASIVL